MGLFLYRYFDDYSESYDGSTCGPQKYAAVKQGEIDLTLLTNGAGVIGGVTKQDLLHFYVSALTPAESGSDNAKPASHPINGLLSAVLKWFKGYYALGQPEADPETSPKTAPATGFADYTEAADGDEDVLALIQASARDAATAPAEVTSHAAAEEATALPTVAADIAGPSDSKVDQSAREKMTHRAFKMEFVKRTYKVEWPQSDKGADKRPKSLVIPKKVAASVAADPSLRSSAQMNSTKRKQAKNEDSAAKRRKGPNV